MATTLGYGMLAMMVAALVAYCIHLSQPTLPSSLTRRRAARAAAREGDCARASVDEAVEERTRAGHERDDTHRGCIETHAAGAGGSVVRHPDGPPVSTREGAQAAVLAVLRQAAELRRRGRGQLTALDEVRNSTMNSSGLGFAANPEWVLSAVPARTHTHTHTCNVSGCFDRPLGPVSGPSSRFVTGVDVAAVDASAAVTRRSPARAPCSFCRG